MTEMRLQRQERNDNLPPSLRGKSEANDEAIHQHEVLNISNS
jgi:hypothetical protein